MADALQACVEPVQVEAVRRLAIDDLSGVCVLRGHQVSCHGHRVSSDLAGRRPIGLFSDGAAQVVVTEDGELVVAQEQSFFRLEPPAPVEDVREVRDGLCVRDCHDDLWCGQGVAWRRIETPDSHIPEGRDRCLVADDRLSCAGPIQFVLDAPEIEDLQWRDTLEIGAADLFALASPHTIRQDHWMHRLVVSKRGDPFYACAVQDGSLTCWREGGSVDDEPPKLEAHILGRELGQVTSLRVAMHHGCLIDGERQVWCWATEMGLQGNGGLYPSSLPVKVGIDDAVEIDVGPLTSCATRSDDSVWCWGTLADTAPWSRQVMSRPTGIVMLDMVDRAGCALADGGDVWCWDVGLKAQGRWTGQGALLGGAADGTSAVPIPVLAGSSFAGIAVARTHACGWSGRDVTCWGRNDVGQLGHAGELDAIEPPTTFALPAQSDIESMALTAEASCALTTAGQVWCWGGNERGSLGSATATPEPAEVPEVDHVVQLVAGREFVCARHDDDRVTCWGGAIQKDEHRHGAPFLRRALHELEPAVRLWSNGQHPCAAHPDGSAHCGHEGDIRPSDLFSPDVLHDIDTSRLATCGLDDANTVVCQSDGVEDPEVGLHDVSALSVTDAQICASVGDDRHLECVGRPLAAYLDEGVGPAYLVPVEVLAPP